MSQISIRTIESILNQYNQELESLDIPDLLTFRLLQSSSTATQPITRSPYVNQFKLQQIKQSLSNLDTELDKHKHNKSYHELRNQLNELYINILDEKIYVNSKLINEFELQNAPISASSSSNDSRNTPETEPKQAGEEGIETREEDLQSLRKRLLSGGKTSSLLDAEKDLSKVNEYHESIQEDIMNELSELTSTLKTSAVKFSSKILGEDLSLLNETNDNIIKNTSLFKVIDRNLNHYLENKTGGKIGVLFLIKVSIGLAIVFFFMMIFIKVIPRF